MVPEFPDLLDGQIMPEEVVLRMQGDAEGLGQLYGSLRCWVSPIGGELLTLRAQLLNIDLRCICPRHEQMVVLEELTIWNQYLTEVHYFLDTAGRNVLLIRDLHEIPVFHQQYGSIDRIAWGDGSSLARPLYLYLCADRNEAIQRLHRRWADSQRREPGGSRPSVPQSEPAGPAGMR